MEIEDFGRPGGLLILADEARGREVEAVVKEGILARARSLSLSLSLSRPPFSDDDAPIAECCSTAGKFLSAVRAGDERILVVDPSYVHRLGDGELAMLVSLLKGRSQLLRPVILYADTTESAMRGTCALAGAARCTLVVRGIDDALLVQEIFAGSGLGPGLHRLVEHILPRMTTLDHRVRAQWECALLAPESTCVKRIAAECGVSRRTMERWFAQCQLPSPGRLFAMAAEAHELDRHDEKRTPAAAERRVTRARGFTFRR